MKCPLKRITNTIHVDCETNNCAWWDVQNQCCALLSMTKALSGLNEKKGQIINEHGELKLEELIVYNN